MKFGTTCHLTELIVERPTCLHDLGGGVALLTILAHVAYTKRSYALSTTSIIVLVWAYEYIPHTGGGEGVKDVRVRIDAETL